jgi:hypothetical protein
MSASKAFSARSRGVHVPARGSSTVRSAVVVQPHGHGVPHLLDSRLIAEVEADDPQRSQVRHAEEAAQVLIRGGPVRELPEVIPLDRTDDPILDRGQFLPQGLHVAPDELVEGELAVLVLAIAPHVVPVVGPRRVQHVPHEDREAVLRSCHGPHPVAEEVQFPDRVMEAARRDEGVSSEGPRDGQRPHSEPVSISEASTSMHPLPTEQSSRADALPP